jgi:protein-S-isoprenylcysteine O-methyltransferase Ste14
MTLESVWTWLFWGWVALEVVIGVATRTRRGGGAIHDRSSQIILWVVIVGSIVVCQSIAPHRMRNLPGAATWLLPVSLLVLVAGLVIRIVAIATLGKAFSANVAIRPEQRVLRHGIYRVVRHPSYMGMLVVFVAVGLNAGTWMSLGVVLVLTTLAILYRIHIEEEVLRGAFGEDYAAYCRTTKRLIPGIF